MAFWGRIVLYYIIFYYIICLLYYIILYISLFYSMLDCILIQYCIYALPIVLYDYFTWTDIHLEHMLKI